MKSIAAAPLEELRQELPSAASSAYLNAGTLGPMPQPVVTAMAARLAADADRRQPPTLWTELLELQQAARAAGARLAGAEPAQVSLQHTTHAGINACLWGLGLGPGDSIVTSGEEHPGVLVPLRILQDRLHIDVRMVDWSRDEQSFVDGLIAACDSTTKVVVISHVSWLSGAVLDLAALRAAVPAPVKLVVDGAQGAGAMPVNVRDGWDAYTVSGQKWPCGPNGSGALVLADPEAWLPTFGAFFTTTDPEQCSTAPYQTDGRRLEHSQEDALPLVGFAAAVEFLLERVGLDRATARSAELNATARRLLGRFVESDEDLRGERHLLTLRLPGAGAADVASALGEQGVVVRNLGPDLLRLSLGWWNDEADLHRCADALEAALSR